MPPPVSEYASADAHAARAVINGEMMAATLDTGVASSQFPDVPYRARAMTLTEARRLTVTSDRATCS